jgi:TRAP-type C4-dicarboxylate transport system permease large subunit
VSVIPYVALSILMLAIVFVVPEVALWLPRVLS